MIEERSINQNADTWNTFPTKKHICQWGVGFGFYGQPKPVFFFFIKKVLSEIQIFLDANKE